MNNYQNRVKQYYDQTASKKTNETKESNASTTLETYVVIVIFYNGKKMLGCTSTFCPSNADAMRVVSEFFNSEDEFKKSVAEGLKVDLTNASVSVVIAKNNDENNFNDFLTD